MCKSKTDGGLRCAAHTRPAMEKAAAALAEVTAQQTGRPRHGTPEYRTWLDAYEPWLDAAITYASTPTGQAWAREQRDTATAGSDAHFEFTMICDRGAGMAIWAKETAQQIKAARQAAAPVIVEVPLSTLDALYSEDFPGTTVKQMRSRWLRNAERSNRAVYRDHGGPSGYLAHLAADIKTRGITEPVTVAVYPDGTETLYDGHHRVLAAHDAAATQIPVERRPITELTGCVDPPPHPRTWRRTDTD